MQAPTVNNQLLIFSDNKSFIGAVYTKEDKDLVIVPKSTEREVIGWVATVALILSKGEYYLTFKKRVMLFKKLLVNHAKIKAHIKAHIKELEEGIENRVIERRKYDKDSVQYAWFDSSIEDMVEYKESLKKVLEVDKVTDSKIPVSEIEVSRAKEYPIDQLLDFKRDNFCSCIFNHEDKTPSMKYYPTTNSVHCFSCHKSADAISVYMHLNNCDFIKAVRELSK